MKIILIQPPTELSDKPKVEAENAWHITRPFSLIYLKEFLDREYNWEVEILDFLSIQNINKSLEILKDYKADVFGVTATSYSRFSAIKVIKEIKDIFPNSMIAVGGCHFGNAPIDTLTNLPEVDYVVEGEGELPLFNLLQYLDKKIPISDVGGIYFRLGKEIKNNLRSKGHCNINYISENFFNESYKELFFGSYDSYGISIMSSRGCPNNCIFCSKSGTRYRLKTPSLVIDEIECIIKKYGITNFNFLDLTLTASKKHIQELCSLIIERKLKIKWWAESKVDIDYKSLVLMKNAGCVNLVIGVESGSPNVLKTIKKRITPAQVLTFCKHCFNIGINVNAYFMYSFPDETYKDIELTYKLFSELSIYYKVYCSIQCCMIFPGTELERIAINKNIISNNFSWTEPYSNDLNIKLGQLPNIPLFIDSFLPEELIEIKEKFKSLYSEERESIKYLIFLAKEKGLFKSTIRLIISIFFKGNMKFLKLLFNKSLYKEWFYKSKKSNL